MELDSKDMQLLETLEENAKTPIQEIAEKTGIPALLNTSFNLHGEPIVRTIQDALRVFDKSELEVLWLDEHIIEKK